MTIADQLANVLKVKRHIPGYVVTPAVLPPTATLADIEALQVGARLTHPPRAGQRGPIPGVPCGAAPCASALWALAPSLRLAAPPCPSPCPAPAPAPSPRTAPPQTARGFTSACITDSGELGGRLLGLVTTRDVDFVNDRHTPLSEIMTRCARNPARSAEALGAGRAIWGGGQAGRGPRSASALARARGPRPVRSRLHRQAAPRPARPPRPLGEAGRRQPAAEPPPSPPPTPATAQRPGDRPRGHRPRGRNGTAA
jgi:CBS domain-containing protein